LLATVFVLVASIDCANNKFFIPTNASDKLLTNLVAKRSSFVIQSKFVLLAKYKPCAQNAAVTFRIQNGGGLGVT